MSGGLRVCERLTLRISSICSRAAATAPNAARACLPYQTPSQAQRWPPALCGLPGVFPGSFILSQDDRSAGLQRDRHLVWQKLQRLGTVHEMYLRTASCAKDDGLVRAPSCTYYPVLPTRTKKAGRTRTTPETARTVKWSTWKLSSFNPLTGSEQSRRS